MPDPLSLLLLLLLLLNPIMLWPQNPNVHGVRGKINTFRFDKETLERAGMGDAAGSNTPPFLVSTAVL